jgi:hypothetical protein
MEKISSKTTPFKIEYWLGKGFSENEAIDKVKIHKLKCGRTLESFIFNHGEVDGLIKYKEFCDKSKHTLETFVFKYGEVDGTNKWFEYLKTKDSNSKDWALKKSNGDINIANEMLIERKKSVVVSLEKLIKKYGDINIAKTKLNEINQNKDGSSMNYFLKKTNGDRKKAIDLYQKFSLKKDCMSINFFLKKTNGDLKLAKILQIEELKKRDVSFFTASKESLKYFIPLYKHLRKNGVERNDIFLGVSGSYEYRLHDLENNLTFSYDLTILSLNIIIEYHGEKFHPNIQKYGVSKLKEDAWGKYFRLNLEESITKDKNKKQLALKNGFDYLELWSSDSEVINKEKINKIIKQKLNENKKYN